MVLLRNHHLSRRLHWLLLHKPPPLSHTLQPITSSSQTHESSNKKQPLLALFMEAVGLGDKTPTIPQQEGQESSENSELKKNLKQLEEELLGLKGKNSKDVAAVTKTTAVRSKKRRSLFAVFTNQPDHDGECGGDDDVRNVKGVELREPMVLKKLPPDMEFFVEHLFQSGYFKDANFAKGKKRFDFSWFESYFAWGYIKFAAQRFGSDNQEIAKWLSGSDLKQVAMFGCPSTDRKSVFPAKRLRRYLEVPENTVCSQCVLRESCKFANQSVSNDDTKTLDLVVVLRVLTSYALELVHHRLVVPDEVNKSVSKLLKEVVKLSQTTGDHTRFTENNFHCFKQISWKHLDSHHQNCLQAQSWPSKPLLKITILTAQPWKLLFEEATSSP